MIKRTKRRIALLLILLLLISLASPMALAADKSEISAANSLYELGLFEGVGENNDGTPVYELDRVMNRSEAVTMLIRLLGLEDTALSGAWETPFIDLVPWAEPYVGCAYDRGLTTGLTETTFGSADNVTAGQYMIFLLRALGYVSGEDFENTDAVAFANSQGIECSLSLDDPMTRGKAALASFDALNAEMKGSSGTLLDSLTASGAVTTGSAASYGVKSKTALSASEIYKKCADAVFYIETYNRRGEPDGNATGFFISPDGVALTNYHVLELSNSAKVFLGDNEDGFDVKGVYKYSIEDDWAVIQVDGKNFPYLEINTIKPSPGDWVCAIGCPLGLRHTISDGIVSALDRVVDGSTYIQMTVPTYPGSSGSALLDSEGRVIGITRGSLSDGTQLNIAVPIGKVDTKIGNMSTVHISTITPEPVLYALRDDVKVNTLTLQQGESVTLTFYENVLSNVTLTKYIDDPSVISTFWGAWLDNHHATMEILGYSKGSTMLTVIMTYQDEELARIEIEVTVI